MSKQSKVSAHFLSLIGIKEFRNLDKFWAYMSKKHGEAECQRLDDALVSQSSGDSESFYQTINRSLDLSLDIASLRRQLYTSYLEWFISSFAVKPGILVDTGCGNGILTCSYATAYPELQVVGLDKSEQAVNCARTLAERLKLSNVEFHHVDVEQDWPIAESSVDFAVSLTGLNVPTVYRDPNDDVTSWSEKICGSMRIQAIDNAARYLKEGGTFLSVDRLPYFETEFAWAAAMENAGLCIDADQVTDIAFEDLGTEAEWLPVYVAIKGARKQLSPNDLVSLLVERRGGLEKLQFGEPNETLAEVVFAAINPKQFVAGWKAAYTDGSGIASYELWSAGPFVLLYTTSTLGFRELKFLPLHSLANVIAQTQIDMDALGTAATVSTY